ncbi:hypothetical protein NECID01_0154 [Nematocida sp. AWRm77]|nr:hypothetical protein NECID01_0154 [Nematocida sp. AWRm77]
MKKTLQFASCCVCILIIAYQCEPSTSYVKVPSESENKNQIVGEAKEGMYLRITREKNHNTNQMRIKVPLSNLLMMGGTLMLAMIGVACYIAKYKYGFFYLPIIDTASDTGSSFHNTTVIDTVTDTVADTVTETNITAQTKDLIYKGRISKLSKYLIDLNQCMDGSSISYIGSPMRITNYLFDITNNLYKQSDIEIDSSSSNYNTTREITEKLLTDYRSSIDNISDEELNAYITKKLSAFLCVLKRNQIEVKQEELLEKYASSYAMFLSTELFPIFLNEVDLNHITADDSILDKKSENYLTDSFLSVLNLLIEELLVDRKGNLTRDDIFKSSVTARLVSDINQNMSRFTRRLNRNMTPEKLKETFMTSLFKVFLSFNPHLFENTMLYSLNLTEEESKNIFNKLYMFLDKK